MFMPPYLLNHAYPAVPGSHPPRNRHSSHRGTRGLEHARPSPSQRQDHRPRPRSHRLLTSTYPPRAVHREQHGCRRHLLSSMQYPQHTGNNARHVPDPPNSTVRRRISPRVATAPAPGVEKGNKGRIEKSIPRACYYCYSHSSRDDTSYLSTRSASRSHASRGTVWPCARPGSAINTPPSSTGGGRVW